MHAPCQLQPIEFTEEQVKMKAIKHRPPNKGVRSLSSVYEAKGRLEFSGDW
jgi:hypothetical protein